MRSAVFEDAGEVRQDGFTALHRIMIAVSVDEVKNRTLSYMSIVLAPGGVVGYCPPMWWVPGVLIVLATATGAAARPSNPAFLGIGMRDLGGVPVGGPPGLGAIGPCQVESVTRGSGAKAAGLQPGDLLLTIDGAPVPSCDAVLRVVQAHEPGDLVPIDVNRYGRMLRLSAQLVSRDEILRRRLVGQPLGATALWAVEEGRAVDLGAARGRTTIVGLFDIARCDGCASVFTAVAGWTRGQAARGTALPMVGLAVTPGEPDLAPTRALPTLDVPLALAAPARFEELTIPDSERIHFLVVDCRGVVQHVAPIAPGADDTQAVLDELFAAAEQASRRGGR